MLINVVTYDKSISLEITSHSKRNNLNGPVSIKEIKLIAKILLTKEFLDQMALTVKSTKQLRKN